MNCPNCDTKLVVNVQQGLEVDSCPVCNGVWLDSGDIDRFIAPAEKEHTSIRIPSVTSQKQANYELIYDGSIPEKHMKAV